MTYIVTGAAGFIGSNIVKTLNSRGVSDIIAVDEMSNGDKFRNLADCQIADFIDLIDYAKICENKKSIVKSNKKIRAVLHNGACADTMENDGRFMMEVNFSFSKNVFQWCQKFGLPFIYASSASVYGINRNTREGITNENPVNMYAYSKLAFDQFIRKNIKKSPNTVVGLRYFNVYGPREKSKGKMASMIFQLSEQLRKTGVAKLFVGTEEFHDGEQKRDFVFVGDVAKVNLFFADNPKIKKGIFNVGTGAARSFNDAANIIIKLLGNGKIEYVPFPEKLIGKYQSFTQADLTSLVKSGYKDKFLSLEDGINASWKSWIRD